MLLVAIWSLTIITMVTLRGDAVVGAGVQSLLFLEAFGFFIYSWLKQGQTLGMSAWRLRILADDGADLELAQVTMRFAGACLSIVCLGLGYLWCLVDKKKRTWPDILSNSHVVYEKTSTTG